MKYSVRYQPRARREYQSAMEWYYGKSVDAAINFAVALKERVEFILQKPDRFEKYIKNLEKWL